ncbi:sulfate ABC transporter permease [Propionibacterium freudenreichii]|uniref:sulfate ABC transporter permease n=1 Tax=Propionibacterium freudenreichii TaxID=1744 RepID=UPI000A6298DD|nr:sulfate ABC transporter permease subunit [Propionibacterium freudenreichii]SBM42388.1 CysW [Propionibacterium freudenreichii]SCQ45181.1 CysW [Propionibacterium freudenreichii]SCQ49094.1 CysW [Propionibacterium freudenreichii]
MIREPRPVKWGLRLFAIAYLTLLVAWPVALVVRNTFSSGFGVVAQTLSSPQVTSALRLTAIVAGIAVMINLVFGVGISLLLVRYRFPGRRILSLLVDLPMSVSPVVVGLALTLVYAKDAALGGALFHAGYRIIFATPGMVLATVFVSLPLMIRELVPVLQEIGDDQEQAANSLGASGWQAFWRITLPGIKWAVVYGVVLSLARSLGEFGAVKVVSGNVSQLTQTATLAVEETYQNFDQQTAYTVALLLTLATVISIIVVSILRPKETAK